MHYFFFFLSSRDIKREQSSVAYGDTSSTKRARRRQAERKLVTCSKDMRGKSVLLGKREKERVRRGRGGRGQAQG